MKQHLPTTIFDAEQSSQWRREQAGIWSRDGVDMETAPAQSILTTLFDQPRWLEVHHLYDQRGSELFEAICELPEYYLTRTENAILEASASQIIEA
ncbi:MAG TPA: L-histidine N(alpha)-methyltransferase, partial [Candidatus Saccharimonadales bacterium]|nr:L-histidine N(alpha)-methyltransferase [Candidatus Saccharimonadales bacterium]